MKLTFQKTKPFFAVKVQLTNGKTKKTKLIVFLNKKIGRLRFVQ